MDKNVKIFVTTVVALVVVVAGVAFLRTKDSAAPVAPGQYDTLAQCIKDSGATFYGAFWCPHCQGQKKLFGSSAKLLPYVECSTPDGTGQTQVCIDKKIQSYPTWVLKDGTIIPNENGAGITLPTLAAKTGCQMPVPN